MAATITNIGTRNVAIGTSDYDRGNAWWNAMGPRFRKCLLLRSHIQTINGKLTREGRALIDGDWRDLSARERATLLDQNSHLLST